MGKKLYVGNLSYSVTNSELEELFSRFGNVESAEVISDRATGRSKGFGFVEMSTEQEAQEAINALNGKDYNGRPLTVNEAKPREERSRGGYGNGGGGGAHAAGKLCAAPRQTTNRNSSPLSSRLVAIKRGRTT